MKTFYLTFGQKYPWRNGWVEVQAEDYDTARAMVTDIFDDKWAFLYDPKDFGSRQIKFFNQGEIGETIK